MSEPRPTRPGDDRSTKARIRDAAIACIAELGARGTTARRVADAAGVSPGLVIHHFGSMDGLRAACDAHVAATIRKEKHEAMARGPGFDLLAALRQSEAQPLMAYLARVLTEDTDAVARLVDDLVADAEVYLEEGVASGMLRAASEPRARAAVLTLWSLGALVLHRHVERILGVDLTAAEIGTGPAVAGYVGATTEMLAEGVLTESFAADLSGGLAALRIEGAA